MNKHLLKIALPAVALVLAGSAYAVPTLTVSDNNGHTTGAITSGTGIVAFNGALGDWDINILSAITFPAVGSATKPKMDVSGQDQYAGVGGLGSVLTITFSGDGFSPIANSILAQLSANAVDGSGSVKYTVSASGVGTVATIGPVNTPPAFGASQGGAITAGFTGTITETIVLSANPGYFASFDAGLKTVPDSGTTLILLGSSLTLLGFFARSRKQAAA